LAVDEELTPYPFDRVRGLGNHRRVHGVWPTNPPVSALMMLNVCITPPPAQLHFDHLQRLAAAHSWAEA
jgi:hypothetical protein